MARLQTHRLLAATTLAACATIPGLAQTAAPAVAPDTSAPASSEEVVVLTPFEVTASSDTGYVATDTLAGTRIRSDLRDIGSAISVITKDLMNDIGATDASTLLQYTTSTEVAGTRGTYSGLNGGTSEQGSLINPTSAQRVRGLAAADNTRDYFVSDIPWDSYNVDRIDILRGPNSFLFGLGSPAGIQNASLQNASFADQGRLDHRIASYGSQRVALNVNEQLIDNVLAIRVAGLWDHQNYRQKPAFQNDNRIYGAVRWDPNLFKNRTFHTSIKLKYEAGDIKANRQRNVTPGDQITAWYRPVLANTTDNPFGGMGRVIAGDAFTVYRTDNYAAGAGRGAMATAAPVGTFIPWMNEAVNVQQPVWTIDGATDQHYGVYGGFINAGAISSTGALTGASNGIPGKRQNGMFFQVNGLSARATNTTAPLPNQQFGVYRNQSLLDPTIFDFYNTLLDGPNKSEFQRWTAYNFDFSQTGWNDRVGLNLIYDRQKNKLGGETLLGYAPAISIDLNAQLADGTPNPNVGRPFVAGAGNAGSGTWTFSDREYMRGSLFAELRVSDLTKNAFLVKLLGKHRFNGVASKDKYFREARNYQLYANDQAWAGYWNGNDGSGSSIGDRPPVALIYLGPSVTGLASATGANIPGIRTRITLPDQGIQVFDPTPTNLMVNPAAPWTVPAELDYAFQNTATTQASNPANMVGWNARWASNLMRGAGDSNPALTTLAQKSLKETLSYAGSYQGFLWNNALVTTLGWRFDTIKTKDVTAGTISVQRNYLNLGETPVVSGTRTIAPYVLPTEFPADQIVKGHSFNWQGVLHLNRILAKDPLPFNVSLSFAKSSNFQVTSIRRDLYGTPIGNPSGETKEYGVVLATKDSKYSMRVLKFETSVALGDSTLPNAATLGGIVSNGLNWRNVFLYQLSAYGPVTATSESPSYRNTWSNAYPLRDASGNALTVGAPGYDAALAASIARMDQAITGWNQIQTWLGARGFFQAWNFTPINSSALVDRTTYASNRTQYAPAAGTVYNYGATAPQGFTVTADTISKGYEFELTANPTPNLRISANAAKTTATRNNVGGASLTEFIAYMDRMLLDPANTATGLTAAGELPRYGGASNAIGSSVYGVWRSSYVKMRLQEGTQADEIRQWRYNVMGNYSFHEGFLKGAGVGAAYRWQDKVVIGYPVLASGNYDLTRPYYGPSEDGLDLWFSYERKLTSRINWKIQLNVRNVLAKDSLIPTAIEPDGYTWATVRLAPNREWMLTNSFMF